MTKDKKKALWACARCERRKEIPDVNIDPVVLRVCDYCGIENWVRPVGHAGKGAGAVNQTLTEEQAVLHAEAIVEALTPENTTGEGEVAESIPEEEEAPEEDPKKAEREALEAEIEAKRKKLAELEGE